MDRCTRRRRVDLAVWLGVTALLLAGLVGTRWGRFGSEGARLVPAPAVDEAATSGSETAVLAGGCFWGVQGVFQHVPGVSQAVSGYAGGSASTASYEAVSGGATGHAEAVRITFDPARVSYGQLLRIYFSVVQDPTQLDRQGPDDGSQYRSAIFTQDQSQARVARAYLSQLEQATVFHAPIVTRTETGDFFPAEDYHQNYLNTHPASPYILLNDRPKIHDLQRLFPGRYREQPVLVGV